MNDGSCSSKNSYVKKSAIINAIPHEEEAANCFQTESAA